jgi:nucleoside-diphosphate-sugar epimerase
VRAVDLNLDTLADLKGDTAVTLVSADIRKTDALRTYLEGVDVVFHLASAHLEVTRSDDFFWDVNANAVGRLLAQAELAGVRRFVHCSSVGVYGRVESLPADEQSPCNPDILYEQTKLAGEQAVRDYMASGKVECVILRPTWVYGPGCPRTAKLIRSIDRGRFVFVGSGRNLRHPIYVKDLCNAFHRAAVTDGISGETMIVGGEQPVELRSLIREIAQAVGRKNRFLRIPFMVVTPVCRAMDLLAKVLKREPPFSSRSLKFFSESSAFDISRANRLIAFSPQYSLDDGIAETASLYRLGREQRKVV